MSGATTRERAYFLQGRLKALREQAAYYGSTIDALTVGMNAANAEAAALEEELRALRDTHYAEFATEAEAWAKDIAQGRAEDFRDGSAA